MASAEASGLKEPMACTSNSDFAIICSFFEQLGDKLGLLFPSFQDLQHMLENVDEGTFRFGFPSTGRCRRQVLLFCFDFFL